MLSAFVFGPLKKDKTRPGKGALVGYVKQSRTVKRSDHEQCRRCKMRLSERATGLGGTSALNFSSAGGTIELIMLAVLVPH